MEQLKPCPWCGNTPLIAQCSPFRDCDWIVSCESTCLVGPATNNLAKDEAIAAWNTRAPDEQIRKLREALTAQCEWLRCQEGGEEYPAMGCECEPCIITRRVREALEDTK